MQNYPSSGTGSNPFYFSTPLRGSSSSSLSGQTPGGGGGAADGMARITSKLDELDRVLLEGKQGIIVWGGGLCVCLCEVLL